MKKEETVDFHIKSLWHSIARMYNQQASKFDGSYSSGFVLLNIDPYEGTPATKIAPMMGLEARSLTRILKRLEEQGMISKKRDPNDGRSVLVYLTSDGVKKREYSRETVLKFNQAVQKGLDPAELQAYLKTSIKIRKLIEENDIF